MARINTNVPALVAQQALRQNQTALQTSLERLSTGLRINSGADDPAGLITSEELRAEISGTNQAISNAQQATNIIATGEGALNEVSSLLVDIQGLIVETANNAALSDDEKQANQLQIDSAIESITRIANTTSFAGRNLLNGSLDYITSGINSNALATVAVQGAQFGTANFIPVNVVVTTSAQKGTLYWRHASIGAGQNVSIQLQGTNGVTSYEWGSGMKASAIVAAVNMESQSTGVQASLINNNPNSGVAFQSTQYGSDQFVAVNSLPTGDQFDVVDAGGNAKSRETGQDAVAQVNGATARGHGLDLALKTQALDMNFTLKENFGLGSTHFAITGGGALFQLGPDVSTNQQVNIGIQSVAATNLGNANIGFLDQIMQGEQYDVMNGPVNASKASDIVNEAINQVAVLRGRLGAFERNTLQTNINSLSITMENLTSSESAIRDTDFAAETSNLTRNQILVNAGTSVLALANSSSQSVLSLLRTQ